MRDFNDLVAQGLCTTGLDCYIDFAEAGILDTVELPSTEILDLFISDFTPDSTPPTITEFTSLDLVSGVINITFSESVDVSTLNTTAIILQSFFEGDSENYRLSDLSSSSPTGPFVSIQLADEDISAIKVREQLCVFRSNCYLTADGGVIRDIGSNPSADVPPGPPGLIVTFLNEDSVSPVLMDFELDLNNETLTLIFSEPVDPTTFNFAGLTLQSRQGVLELVESFQLTGGSVASQGDMSTVLLQLLPQDINSIKAFPVLATNLTTTFLSVGSTAVMDLATTPNSVVPISPTLALPADAYTRDAIGPVLLDFILDINIDLLILTFSEPVRKSSLNFTNIVLYSTNSSDNAEDFPFALTTGSFLNPENDLSNVVTVVVDRLDIGEIKINSSIGTSVEDTFLEVLGSAIEDRAGNGL